MTLFPEDHPAESGQDTDRRPHFPRGRFVLPWPEKAVNTCHVVTTVSREQRGFHR